MKKVYIMRGLPGSGKNRFIDSCDFGSSTTICSADDYFMVNGTYQYDASMIGEAHNSCMRKFLIALGSDIEIVVVNNTNTNAWEISPYIAVAKAMGYQAEIIQIEASVDECIVRNTHGVAPQIIGAMNEAMRREQLPVHWNVIKK